MSYILSYVDHRKKSNKNFYYEAKKFLFSNIKSMLRKIPGSGSINLPQFITTSFILLVTFYG